jgi:signal transduction histidine kinase
MAAKRWWRRGATVRLRATLAATVVVGVALAAGGVGLVLLLHRSQVAAVRSAATLRATEIVGLVRAGRLPNPIPAKADDSSLVQVIDAAGQVVAQSENIDGEARLAHFAPGAAAPAVRTMHGLPIADPASAYIVVAVRARAPDGERVVYVATSLGSVDANVRQVGTILATGLPLLLVLVGGTTWVMVGRALRPVERIRAEVADLSARNLGRRVPEPDTDDEIGRLARTMNAMLERLQRSTERERRFVGDASHELRSPIAAMRAGLEVSRADAFRAWMDTDQEMLDEVLRMERLVDDLLLLARTDARPDGRGAAMDLDDVVLAEVGRAREMGTVPVSVEAFAPARVRGDALELGRVVRNLLENAQRHATSMVTVELSVHDGIVALAVSDDGPGIPPEDRERIFERFTRLDEARDRDHGGAGLGLAIARDVLRLHGGDIHVEGGARGGARFVVTLPAASEPAVSR